jgi:hypothetical protein
MHVREVINHESTVLSGSFILVIRWAQLSKPYFFPKAVAFSWSLDPQISADVSRWTVETNIVFLRILIGCLIGTMLVFLIRVLCLQLVQKRLHFMEE